MMQESKKGRIYLITVLIMGGILALYFLRYTLFEYSIQGASEWMIDFREWNIVDKPILEQVYAYLLRTFFLFVGVKQSTFLGLHFILRFISCILVFFIMQTAVSRYGSRVAVAVYALVPYQILALEYADSRLLQECLILGLLLLMVKTYQYCSISSSELPNYLLIVGTAVLLGISTMVHYVAVCLFLVMVVLLLIKKLRYGICFLISFILSMGIGSAMVAWKENYNILGWITERILSIIQRSFVFQSMQQMNDYWNLLLKELNQENLLLFGISLALVIIGYVGIWFYSKHKRQPHILLCATLPIAIIMTAGIVSYTSVSNMLIASICLGCLAIASFATSIADHKAMVLSIEAENQDQIKKGIEVTLSELEQKEKDLSQTFDMSKGVKYLDNPLPVPKRKERKGMDYDYEVPQNEMNFDVDLNSSNSEFDLQ